MCTTRIDAPLPITDVETLPGLEAGEDASDEKASKANGIVLDLEFKRVKKQWNEARYWYDDIELEEQYISAFDVGYAFSVVRTLIPGTHTPYVAIHVRSRQFIAVARRVMAAKRNVVWQTIPVKFDEHELLAFLPQFIKELEERQSKPVEEGPDIGEHNNVVHHLEYLVNFLQNEYSDRIKTLTSLHATRYIDFDSLWALLLPGMILKTTCTVTGAPRLVRLITTSQREGRSNSPSGWALRVEYVDMVSGRVGLVEEELIQEKFFGDKPIWELVAYPFVEPVGNEKALVDNYKAVKAQLVDRGRRRSKIEEQSCMWYDGDGFYKDGKRPLQSRIVIDRDMYDQQAGHSTPNLAYDLDHEMISLESRTTLTDDEYALMAPRIYGFELEQKQWCQFRVDKIEDIVWNVDLFDELNLDKEHKMLLKVMVDACSPAIKKTGAKFDDFLWGKGKGFICNLHGPPGVGKTLTIEALSEVKKKVLYVVGCGDLGAKAGDIEKNLSNIFRLAIRWSAIVLIHAADVYLESPEIRDVECNTIESVFMRKLEYHPGVVFLTTNRDTVFEGGIRSRIDLLLFYHQPTLEAREQLWAMFVKRNNMSQEEQQIFNKRCMADVRNLCLNGREIKNVVKLAKTSAKHPSPHCGLEAADIISMIDFLKMQGQIGGMFLAEPKVNALATSSEMTFFSHVVCGVAVALTLSILAAWFSVVM